MRKIYCLMLVLLSVSVIQFGCGDSGTEAVTEPDTSAEETEPGGEAEDNDDDACRLLEERLEAEINRNTRLENRLEDRIESGNQAVRSRDTWMTLTLTASAAAVVLFIAGIIMGANTRREAENNDQTQNTQP